MQLDWRIHFLGWHFFRNESWHWPPGRIEGYFAPAGTAVGFTDSIPLVAFLLKPLSPLLPGTLQYLGAWLLVCFILQGVFGVLIARLWTSSRVLQLLVAALFVLMPTLLIRVGHPSLCAHWLLLWALWLYLRGEPGSAQSAGTQAALGLLAGLMHPYLAVMVLAILAALAARDGFASRLGTPARRHDGVRRALAGFASAVAAVIVGWWLAGLFTVTGAENLASDGLAYFSMNLLSPITPSGWSTLLPALPVASPGQTFEGFQYFGAGVLALIALAAILAIRNRPGLPWRSLWPLIVATLVCAGYALSPRITLSDIVVLDVSSVELSRFALFRATGRFFWPFAYLVLAATVALVLRRLPARVSAAVLAGAVVLQVVDLSGAHRERRAVSRSDAFHGHTLKLTSPVWAAALPHYDHMRLLHPQHCGAAPIGFEWPAYLAGLYGLTINAGEVARTDADRMRRDCASLSADLAAGRVSHDTIYLVSRPFVEPLKAIATAPLVCVDVDDIPVCVTAASFSKWGAR
jgi:hypothetical protein